jgi:spore coat protein U-like protein
MEMTMHEPSRNAQRSICIFLTLAGLHTTPIGQTFTVTSGMPVRIEIITACTISASDLDFGPYHSSLTAPVLGQSTIELNCGAGVVTELSLDGGTGPGGNTSRRKLSMESGIDRLDYNLYQDAGRTIHWGDKSGRDTREVITTGLPQTIPVYGEIPAGQRARDGTYSDVITVTVQF